MKIICAGLPKTGTKSMNAALSQLGYKVYDLFEHMEVLEDGWKKIAAGEEPVPLLREMYDDVDVGVGTPIWGFWEELMDAFPNAKVILNVRDNVDDFTTSMARQIRHNNSVMGMLNILSPTYLNFTRMFRILATYGIPRTEDPRRSRGMHPKVHTMLFRQHYRRHIAYVTQCCPEDRLLVFNCKEGWEPLCKFLWLPIPDEPFPHKNIKGEFAKDLANSKTFRRAKKETFVFSSLIFVGVVAMSYLCVRSR